MQVVDDMAMLDMCMRRLRLILNCSRELWCRVSSAFLKLKTHALKVTCQLSTPKVLRERVARVLRPQDLLEKDTTAPHVVLHPQQ